MAFRLTFYPAAGSPETYRVPGNDPDTALAAFIKEARSLLGMGAIVYSHANTVVSITPCEWSR